MNNPSSVSLTPAEEGVRVWDAKLSGADAKTREAFLDFGHALLKLRREVGDNDTAFGKKLSALNLKIVDKDVRADAQKLAFQVEIGLKTREDALALPARVVHALPGLSNSSIGLVLKPKVPRNPKPKAPKPPDQFDQPPPLADTPETDDDDAHAIDQGEAEEEADEFASSDDGSQVGEQNLEALADEARKLAEDADDGGEAEVVGDAASTITRSLPEALVGAIRKEVQSGKKSRARLEATAAKDTSGASRRMLLLMDVLAALGG